MTSKIKTQSYERSRFHILQMPKGLGACVRRLACITAENRKPLYRRTDKDLAPIVSEVVDTTIYWTKHLRIATHIVCVSNPLSDICLLSVRAITL